MIIERDHRSSDKLEDRIPIWTALEIPVFDFIDEYKRRVEKLKMH